MSGSKSFPAASHVAMKFVGRTFVRLRNIQRRSKQRLDSVQLIIKGDLVTIDLDGRVLLKVSREAYNWNIEIMNALDNLLALESCVVL